MIQKIAYTLIISLFFTNNIQAQVHQESIESLHLDTLYQRFKKYYIKSDSIQALKYANAYFQKARKLKDTNIIAKGYYSRIISNYTNTPRNDLYDSIIALKDGLKNSSFLTIAYYDLGINHSNNFQYSQALTNYLEARKYNSSNKQYFDFKINLEIATLKLRIEENQEALTLLKKFWKIAQENNYEKKYPNEYISTLLRLSDAYRKVHLRDSAKTYITLGLQKSKEKDKAQYFRFQLLNGITDLNKSYHPDIFLKIEEAIDYLNDINKKTAIDENINISLAHYHIGKAHLKNNNRDKAILNFLKVDSITGNSATILPETVESYTHLKEYYKTKGDTENQLKYLQKLLSFKNNLESQYKFINNEIKNKYDFPLLLEEEKQIINRFEKKNKIFTLVIRILSLIGILIFIFFIYQWFQKKKYKQRFIKLEKQFNSKVDQKRKSNPIEKPNLPDEIYTKVITCLEEFEQKKVFLDRTINLSKLANSTNTNHSYFFKAFKYLKKESFNAYLRDLRLTYAIERLRKDKTFRKYTIKTIAYESGFSNPESFSKYFYKKHKIYPSFFIKQLQKEENTNNCKPTH